MFLLGRRRFLTATTAGVFLSPAAACRSAWGAGKKAKGVGSDPPFVASPLVSLIRDFGVQRELAITADQLPKIEAAVRQVDLPLFLLRDVPPSQGADKYHGLIAQLEASLQQTLTSEQYQRLSELVIRAQGFPALIQPKNVQALQLESQQTQKIQAALEETQRDLQQALAAGKGQEAPAINEKLRQRIEETLTAPQRQRLAGLVGKPFDLSKVRQVACLAPELKEIVRWHNAAPLSMQQLKGKVVALHFYAFG